VVAAAEAAPSLEAAADVLRPDIELPEAVCWMRRRVQRVYAALTALRGVMVHEFLDCPATIDGLRTRLAIEPVRYSGAACSVGTWIS